jgi:predicted AAA+ superfamily ATPase
MIVDREIFKEAKEALACFPILVLTGARQTGKTTLSKLLTNKPYYNLESPDTRVG